MLAALLHVVIREGLVRPRVRAPPMSRRRGAAPAVAPFTPASAERRACCRRDRAGGAHVRRPAPRLRRAGTGPNMAPRGTLTEYLLRASTRCAGAGAARASRCRTRACSCRAVAKAQAGAGAGVRLRREAARARAGEQRRGAAHRRAGRRDPGRGRGADPRADLRGQQSDRGVARSAQDRRAMEALDLLVTLDMKLSATAARALRDRAEALARGGRHLAAEGGDRGLRRAMGYSEPYAQFARRSSSRPRARRDRGVGVLLRPRAAPGPRAEAWPGCARWR